MWGGRLLGLPPFLGHSIAPSSCAGSLFHYYLWFAAAIAGLVVVGVDVVVVGVVPSGRTITSACGVACPFLHCHVYLWLGFIFCPALLLSFCLVEHCVLVLHLLPSYLGV